MTDMTDVYYEFFQTPEQLRRVGARGGRATARNRRQRRSAAAVPEAHSPRDAAAERRETVAVAIALLDAQFPWLRGAEKGGARS